MPQDIFIIHPDIEQYPDDKNYDGVRLNKIKCLIQKCFPEPNYNTQVLFFQKYAPEDLVQHCSTINPPILIFCYRGNNMHHFQRLDELIDEKADLLRAAKNMAFVITSDSPEKLQEITKYGQIVDCLDSWLYHTEAKAIGIDLSQESLTPAQANVLQTVSQTTFSNASFANLKLPGRNWLQTGRAYISYASDYLYSFRSQSAAAPPAAAESAAVKQPIPLLPIVPAAAQMPVHPSPISMARKENKEDKTSLETIPVAGDKPLPRQGG
jgi:hypothetical protein